MGGWATAGLQVPPSPMLRAAPSGTREARLRKSLRLHVPSTMGLLACVEGSDPCRLVRQVKHFCGERGVVHLPASLSQRTVSPAGRAGRGHCPVRFTSVASFPPALTCPSSAP